MGQYEWRGTLVPCARSSLPLREHLILFPEGTSSDGNRVLPFKSALFGAIELLGSAGDNGSKIAVQPVSLTYTKFRGLPMGRNIRPLFAWYGDMEIVPHIWRALCAGPCDVRVEFHQPVTIEQFGDRKALARYSEDRVREGVLSALTGRKIGERETARAATRRDEF